MNKIALIGGGRGFEIARAFFTQYHIHPYPILGPYDDSNLLEIEDLPKDTLLLITFSKNMQRRREIYRSFQGRYRFTTMDRSNLKCDMGEGNIIFPGVIADYGARIGNNNVISGMCYINHHCTIGSGNLFGPGVTMAGGVTIGDDCQIGQGVTFEPNIKIGDNVKIASGAHVVLSQHDDTVIKAKLYNGVIQSWQ